MDRAYLKAIINLLETEMALHDQKFQGLAVHADCKARMEATLAKLKRELSAKESAEDDSVDNPV